MRFLFISLLTILSLKAYGVVELTTTPTLPFFQAVAEGRVQGRTLMTGYAEDDTLSTTVKTLWHGPGIYVWPPGAVIMSVSSTDAEDGPGGTGVRKVEIECLDAQYNTFKEEVVLTGLTAKAMQNECFRPQGLGMVATETGASGVAVGDIYLGTGTPLVGVPPNKYNMIKAGESSSHSGFYTVPAGFTAYFYGAQKSSISNKPLKYGFYSRNGNPVFTQFAGNNIDGQEAAGQPFPDILHEKTEVEARARMDSGTGEFTLKYFVLMVE